MLLRAAARYAQLLCISMQFLGRRQDRGCGPCGAANLNRYRRWQRRERGDDRDCLAAKGIDHAIRLFDLKAMPRGTSGKGNRQQIEDVDARRGGCHRQRLSAASNRDSTVRVNFDRLIMSRAGPLYQSVSETTRFDRPLPRLLQRPATTLEP